MYVDKLRQMDETEVNDRAESRHRRHRELHIECEWKQTPEKAELRRDN